VLAEKIVPGVSVMEFMKQVFPSFGMLSITKQAAEDTEQQSQEEEGQCLHTGGTDLHENGELANLGGSELMVDFAFFSTMHSRRAVAS